LHPEIQTFPFSQNVISSGQRTDDSLNMGNKVALTRAESVVEQFIKDDVTYRQITTFQPGMVLNLDIFDFVFHVHSIVRPS